MSDAIKLDASDVRVSQLKRDDCRGYCADGFVTHYVSLDLRGNGVANKVFSGCQTCCEGFARDLRASLPPIEPPTVDR